MLLIGGKGKRAMASSSSFLLPTYPAIIAASPDFAWARAEAYYTP